MDGAAKGQRSAPAAPIGNTATSVIAPHRYAALDSWRGISACMVALAHIRVVGDTSDWLLIQNSYLFVDFFFVLSGFIIFESYFKRIKEGFSISRFMFLRFGRLYPLHLFVLSLFVLTELSRLSIPDAAAVGSRPPFTDPNSVAALGSQVLLLNAMSLHDADTWNFPSWSIGAEFYTYLIFALVIRFAVKALPLVLAGISIAAALVLLNSGYSHINISFDLGLVRCIAGFGIGALCSRLHQRTDGHFLPSDRRATAGEVAILASVLIFVALSGYNRWSFLGPVVFGAAVLIFAQERGLISKFLRTRPFLFLGTLSYSIYMVHVFVLMILANAVRSAESWTGFELTALVYVDGLRVSLSAQIHGRE
jgi:peptidoglycan/LPS O-acetylase OafA/YrhL